MFFYVGRRFLLFSFYFVIKNIFLDPDLIISYTPGGPKKGGLEGVINGRK